MILSNNHRVKEQNRKLAFAASSNGQASRT